MRNHVDALLTRIATQMFTDNEGERNAAANRFVAVAREAGLHPWDLQFVRVGSDTSWLLSQNASLRRRNEELEAAHQAILAIATPEQRKALALARRPHHRLLERLRSLAKRALGLHWRYGLRTRMNITEDRLRDYERGDREIPETLLSELKAMPPWRPQRVRPVWDALKQQHLRELLDKGVGNDVIAQTLDVPLKSAAHRVAMLRRGDDVHKPAPSAPPIS